MTENIVFAAFFLVLSVSSAVTLFAIRQGGYVAAHRMMGEFWPYLIIRLGGLSIIGIVGAASLLTGG
ncbi:hypothetical protein [Kocuria sp. ZOR0020]|uniref:hypothetical protein n=1 Tax=Kocuria sp. ZOR0020 TaxID=1339234 RepID=UPI0012E03FB5|nr:hypothetical protein [Kocuria sp. ZOR0020]